MYLATGDGLLEGPSEEGMVEQVHGLTWILEGILQQEISGSAHWSIELDNTVQIHEIHLGFFLYHTCIIVEIVHSLGYFLSGCVKF